MREQDKGAGQRSVLLVLGLCGLMLFARFAASQGRYGPFADGPEEGRKIFLQTCAACHGQTARGIPNLGKDLVASPFVRRLSDAELVAFIERGRPARDPMKATGVPMPPRRGNPSPQAGGADP